MDLKIVQFPLGILTLHLMSLRDCDVLKVGTLQTRGQSESGGSNKTSHRERQSTSASSAHKGSSAIKKVDDQCIAAQQFLPSLIDRRQFQLFVVNIAGKGIYCNDIYSMCTCSFIAFVQCALAHSFHLIEFFQPSFVHSDSGIHHVQLTYFAAVNKNDISRVHLGQQCFQNPVVDDALIRFPTSLSAVIILDLRLVFFSHAANQVRPTGSASSAHFLELIFGHAVGKLNALACSRDLLPVQVFQGCVSHHLVRPPKRGPTLPGAESCRNALKRETMGVCVDNPLVLECLAGRHCLLMR